MKKSIQTVYLKDYQPPVFLIDSVDLKFDLFDDYVDVVSHLVIHRNPNNTAKGNTLFLNGDELELRSIFLDGVQLVADKYHISEEALVIENVPDSFELDIETRIYPQKNTALSGLYYVANTYCTQCEAEGFRRITYYLDHPDVLSRFTTTISADANRFPFLLSNGNKIEEGKLDQNRHWVKWQDPFKKPSYLFALVAGDFDVVSDQFTTHSGKNVDLRLFVEKGYRDQGHFALYSLKEAMRWDETTYGREYDLSIYMIVAIDAFNMGAMENKGLNIFNTKYILARPETATDDDYIHILSVIGHEYFHNWSGNRVTCRDWFQLSLKEGLTIFRDQHFTEDLVSHAVMRIRDVTSLREAQFSEDASPLAHPVRPESYIEINNFYTATVYNKGAEVLRILRTLLGKAVFRKGMDVYFSRHDGEAVTIEDFIRAMEDVSNQDLSQFKLWYSQAGTPVVNVVDEYDALKKIYTLTMHQSCPPTPHQSEKKPMLIPIRTSLLFPHRESDNKDENETVLNLTKASQSFQFTNILTRPVPSLLRGFSAPVILNYAYSNDDLIFLCKHETDSFNRFEALQKYILRIIINLVRDYQQDKKLILTKGLTDIFSYLLQREAEDKFALSEMLTFPSEKYIGEQMDYIDVGSIHAVREFVLFEIANTLQELFLKTYQLNQSNTLANQFNVTQIGQRQLKNQCLAYLLLLPQFIELGMQQFNQALGKNMSDTQAALAGLINTDSAARDKALMQFFATWQHDTLVVNKWFALQASSKLPNTLQQVKRLMHHDAFDIKNPNKVYALIGTFGYRNAINFHAENGEGYAFLRDTVEQLDQLNPQVAARMIIPLTRWQRYDKERQKLMREQLVLLKHNKKLSTDLYELVNKSIEVEV